MTDRDCSYDDGKRRFSTRTMLTFERTTEQGGIPCRVCRGIVERGELVRTREWSLEIAHAACGWLRLTDEHDRHEVRRPGTSFSFFEWRCPACGLDACSVRRPRDDDDPRCKRCRPLPELAVGVTVETIVPHRWRVIRGKRPRNVLVPAYTRGVVLTVNPEIVKVHFENPFHYLTEWVRRLAIAPV